MSDKAWQAAHARLRGRQRKNVPARGRRRDIDSKYLLSGFARCATCGGTLSVLSRSHGQQRAFFYGCLAHAKRGDTVCDNALVLPIERVDRAVQATLTKDVLRPAVVRALIDGVFQALQPKRVTANVGALRSDLRALDKKIANLTEAVEDGKAVAPLVAKLQARQTERDELLAAIGAAEAVRQITVDRSTVERRVLEQVTTWQALLTANVADARQALREVLDGPMQFAPDGKAYRFSGNDQRGKLVAGMVGLENSTLCGVPKRFWTLLDDRSGGSDRRLNALAPCRNCISLPSHLSRTYTAFGGRLRWRKDRRASISINLMRPSGRSLHPRSICWCAFASCPRTLGRSSTRSSPRSLANDRGRDGKDDPRALAPRVGTAD